MLNQTSQYPGPIENIEKRITLADIGVIISLSISALTCAFTFGVLWRDVQENTKFRLESTRDQTEMREDIASIKTSVQYLVDLNKEQRERDRERSF